MAKSKGRNQKENVCVCLSMSTIGKINEPQCHFDNFSHPKTNNPNAKEPKGEVGCHRNGFRSPYRLKSNTCVLYMQTIQEKNVETAMLTWHFNIMRSTYNNLENDFAN